MHRGVLALAAGAACAAAALSYLFLRPSLGPEGPPARAPEAAPARHVGASACQGCHPAEAAAWAGSHHDLAMQPATRETALGDFRDAVFRHAGVESRFSERDGKLLVRTDGPDGKLADFAVAWTFGVDPLQQYLIELPGGRLQALQIAWDARPKSQGGQRWFHLQGDAPPPAGDPFHWTGLYQTWNLQCAECHSTNLRKGFDPATRRYTTTWSDADVACEACHGPGSQHVAWAQQARGTRRERADSAAGDGLAVHFESRWSEAWRFGAPGARIAARDAPPDPALGRACAACHARRTQLFEGRLPGLPLEETHRLAPIAPPLYHADGQQREEVYEWGSFLQSRMHAKGVTCVDCHEPHSLRPRAEGNALCGRCHAAEAYDGEAHHGHRAGSAGAACVECHMPARTYMRIHARRDHSLRVPRPDLSQELGVPNACTDCHADRDAAWAAEALDRRIGRAWRDRPTWARALHAGATQGALALPALFELAGDAETPAVVRAAAATLAAPRMRPAFQPAAQRLLADPDPTVRTAALGLLEPLEPRERVRLAAPLLRDAVRGVRVEAAQLLADAPAETLPPELAQARARGLDEWTAAQMLNADQPFAWLNLGNLHLRQGRAEEARAAFERAIELDPQATAAWANLADLLRAEQRDDEGERVLRRGLAASPRAADLHHALGLLLVRRGDGAAALAELRAAAELDPASARHTYVYAVALHSAGRRAEALAALRAAAARHPGEPEILAALVGLSRDAGERGEALRWAEALAEAVPEDASVQRLLAELQAGR
jgi:tetratricopeptide (TPR) repeat protein